MIVTVRSDERLIHGKILNEWCREIEPSCLLIIDDELKNDIFMANVYLSLVPVSLDTQICSSNEAGEFISKKYKESDRIFILSRTPKELLELRKKNVMFYSISVADKRYISKKMEVTDLCKQAVNELLDIGVEIVYQVYPQSDPVRIGKMQ